MNAPLVPTTGVVSLANQFISCLFLVRVVLYILAFLTNFCDMSHVDGGLPKDGDPVFSSDHSTAWASIS